MRRHFLALTLAAALVALPACSSKANDSGKDSDKTVEVFSWWTGPGEEEGLAAMIADFKANHPGVAFDNAAVSGGAGSNAKAILATRLQSNNPPDSYQRHAGLELQDDIKAGKVQDITYLYDAEGWKKVMPEGLLKYLTIDGKIYAVPVNIHRANLIWWNPKVLSDAGIAAAPATWTEFLADAAILKAKGKIPLAIGPAWTQKHLFETVLLGELGADKYEGLWTGKTDWTGADVTAAIGTFTKVLDVSDVKQAAADWQPALDKVVDGSAAFSVMGDWAASYLEGTKKLEYQKGYNVAASPGSAGVYDFLSDSFTLPVGAKHKTAAENWLKEAGSKSGQDAFNPKKGSIPARTDADRSLYKNYLAWAQGEWAKDRIVGSLAHGVVANNAWNAEIDTALGLFTTDHDAAKLASTIKKKYAETK